jgi:uncharacterized protein YdhG (YjbR/CyaY superfamily)
MAKTDFKTIDEYLATHTEDVRAVLQTVRRAIREAVPDAEEAISYQMPAFRLHGRVMIFFAGWKEHYSIYPATDGLVEAFKKDLSGFEISKGTIRFPLSDPVPVKLIGRLAKFRAKVAAEEAKAKAGRKR